MKRIGGHRVRNDEVGDFGEARPYLGRDHGHEYLSEHGSEQEDDKSDAEKRLCEHVHLSSIDSFPVVCQ